MSLLQNIRFTNAEPLRRIGDTSEAQPSDMERLMNRFVSWANMSNKSGIPDGYCAPYGWFLPLKGGGMSSFGLVAGVGTVTSTSYLTTAKAMLAALHKIEGFGEIHKASTSLSLLVKFMAELGKIVGSGEITNVSILKAVANMSASGASAITGEGQINDSPLNLIAWCSTVLTPILGEGDITATLKGWADMSADITSAGDLVTAQSCASAVWSAIAASYNVAGTMGQKLNSAAVGGVDYDALAEAVWDAEISGRTGVEAGKVIEDIKSKTNLIPGLF
jgi:hypothetical protein